MLKCMWFSQFGQYHSLDIILINLITGTQFSLQFARKNEKNFSVAYKSLSKIQYADQPGT